MIVYGRRVAAPSSSRPTVLRSLLQCPVGSSRPQLDSPFLAPEGRLLEVNWLGALVGAWAPLQLTLRVGTVNEHRNHGVAGAPVYAYHSWLPLLPRHHLTL